MFPTSQNPFKPTMVRMQMPDGSGPSISARGFELRADEDGCVEVPNDLVADMRAHGLTLAGEKRAAAAEAPADAPKAPKK